MKKLFSVSLLLILPALFYFSCSKSFLSKSPYGILDSTTLATQAGVEKVLIGAYAMLDGYAIDNNFNTTGGYGSGTSNWIWGGIFGDDAHCGSTPSDQPEIVLIERHAQLPTNTFLNAKWLPIYEGINRANFVLKLMSQATDISAADQARISGEARFLRAFYYLEAKKVFGNAPYIDETMTSYSVPNAAILQDNTLDNSAKLEADAQYSFDNLPATQVAIGRANKWAAATLLGKIYMFENKFAGAKAILTQVLSGGTNSAGIAYGLLDKYPDVFNLAFKNSSESIFAYQSSVNDNSNAANGNYPDVLNYSTGITCCSFNQPTHDFVNAFKTDAVTGLPEPDSYNNSPVTVDTLNQTSFTPYAGTLDPRLDWSVGRRGIPYLDWGVNQGASWVRDPTTFGPFSSIKNVYRQIQQAEYSDVSFWNSPSESSAQNITLIRLADVILWLAECEVELGTNIDQARLYVNMIRQRAANSAGFVFKYLDDSDPSRGFSATPAANYKIGLYTSAWTDAVSARKAVHFERRLELGMEGHRFFDLVRWGEAAGTLNAYYAFEKKNCPVLLSTSFTAGKDEKMPIPQRQLDLSNGTMKQNPGY